MKRLAIGLAVVLGLASAGALGEIYQGGSGGGGGGVSSSLVCLLTGGTDCLMTGAVMFEGATADANELTLTVADPGADVTVTVPAATQTLCGSAGGCAFGASNTYAANDITDADVVDTITASSYTLLTDYEDADVLAKMLNVDGAASGLDADLLDGSSSAAFALVAGGNTFAASNVYAADDITDADVVDTLTASNYLPLAGGTLAGDLIFEGSTADENEITITPADPGADVTITVPATTQTLCGSAGGCAFGASNTYAADDITDADVSDTLTASSLVGSGSTTAAVDLATAEVNGELADANVSNTLTASLFVGSGSSTTAVDLATAEIAGVLDQANLDTDVCLIDGSRPFTGSIIFEGATADDNEITVTPTDPGADVTLTLPATTGTIALTSQITATPWTSVVKAATETIQSDTTETADAELTFSMLANTTYRVRLVVFVTTQTNADWKWSLSGPASPTGVHAAALLQSSTSTSAVTYAAYPSAQSIVQANGSLPSVMTIDAIVQNGANAGALALTWAQAASVASDTSVLKGSYLEYDAL